MNKSILYIIILLFISNCSVNKNESIEYENQIEIFKKIEPIQKEFNQNLKIKKFQDFKINPFIKNNSNNKITFVFINLQISKDLVQIHFRKV